MTSKFDAPSKVILLGEHAVVYGAPAIAVPVSSLRVSISIEESIDGNFSIISNKSDMEALNIGLDDNNHPLIQMTQLILDYFRIPHPNLRFVINSDIPVASGLGSGAAVSTALARAMLFALGQDLEDDQLNEFVYQIERIHHGTPSGIDNTVIVYETPIFYVKGMPIRKLDIHSPFHLVIGDTGLASLTHESVGDVRKLYQSNPKDIQAIFDEIEMLVRHAARYISTGQIIELGKMMTRNHYFLQQLTVSSKELDQLVDIALEYGALGAKLSGGGRGGNMIALVQSSDVQMVKDKLLEAGAVNVYSTLVKQG